MKCFLQNNLHGIQRMYSIDDQTVETYRLACLALNFLEDDNRLDRTVAEASVSALWQKYKDDLSDDLVKKYITYGIQRMNSSSFSLVKALW